MSRNRFIYLTDLMLVPIFILSFYTGVELHIAGQGDNHEIWHNWAVFHVNASLLFMILGIVHVKSHWGWYKGLKTIGCKGKRKVVLSLSVVFFLVIITGLSLFGIEGANSPMGLLHYQIGILTGVLSVCHIAKRKQFLFKGFAANVLGRKYRRAKA